MAEYTTICLDCDHIWDQSHLMGESHTSCPKCKSKRVEAYLGNGLPMQVSAASLDSSWEYEENGRGRYFPQLETSKTCTRSPENFFRSRNAAIEACKRRGFQILDK